MKLAGLDKVDWQGVEHAFGPAVDVPIWLEALANGDAKARAKALAAIDRAVNHQGNITPAAVPTAPFLVQLFEAGIEPAALAVSLADMSVGGFHGNWLLTAFDPVPSAWWPMRAAVLEVYPRFVQMLGDIDDAARSAGSVALTAFPEKRGEGRAALRKAIAKEKVAEPLACMLLALATLGAETKDHPIFETHTSHKSKITALAARIALGILVPTKENALAWKAAKGRSPRTQKIPFNGGDLVDLAAQVTIRALVIAKEEEELASLVDEMGLEAIVPPALHLLLGPPPDERPELPLTLDEIPSAARPFLGLVAAKIAERRAKNGGFYNDTPLEDYGICNVERVIQSQRPLDARWRIARRVRDGKLPAAAWTECLRDLDPKDVEDVVRDLVFSRPVPYALALWWPQKPRDGYDTDRARTPPFDALIAAAARLLDTAQLESILRTTAKDLGSAQLVPIVDVYTERQEPSRTFDPVIEKALGSLHSSGDDVHRILARVPAKRRESLVKHLEFDVLLADASDGTRGVYLRRAWHFCDLIPTASFAKRAAESLVEGTLVSAGDARVIPALVAALADKLSAFGAAGLAALKKVIPKAKPETAAVLALVSESLRHR